MLMTKPASFWDKIADRYSRQPIADEAAYRKKLDVTREYFRPQTEVLELGCGTGSTAIAHAPFVKHIRAVDISSRMIEIARDKADAAGVDNVTFEQSSVEELDVADASVDVVLGLSLLHLLEDKEAAIAKVHDVLKPNGVFVTNTVCLGDRMKFFKLIGPVGRALGLMPLVKVFTVKHLERSLTDAGFLIDYQWQPGRGESFFSGTAVFIVARKSG